MKKRLAIVTTHPIQYYAPLFRLLAQSAALEIKVFYTKGKPDAQQYEPDFGTSISWDIPLLDGYDYHFSENIAHSDKGGFSSIKNPFLIKEIEEYRPESILVFGWAYHSHLQTMRHFKGKIPVYFRGDSTLLDEKSELKTVLRRFFLSWVYRHVDVALYVGSHNKNYFKAHGLKENQLAFVPHAIENSRFQTLNNEQETQLNTWKQELGFGDTAKVILFCGKFIGKKSPDKLLKAFLQLGDKNDIHLLFVGNGPLEENLKNTALGNKNIHFLPFQNQSMMPVVYRLGSFYCLPSSGPGETWGLAVNEAMASGKAVLVSKKCGCSTDLVENGTNGYIFDPDIEADLEQKLQLMLNADTETMGNISAQKIIHWDITKASKSIINIVTKKQL